MLESCHARLLSNRTATSSVSSRVTTHSLKCCSPCRVLLSGFLSSSSSSSRSRRTRQAVASSFEDDPNAEPANDQPLINEQGEERKAKRSRGGLQKQRQQRQRQDRTNVELQATDPMCEQCVPLEQACLFIAVNKCACKQCLGMGIFPLSWGYCLVASNDSACMLHAYK